MKILKIEDSKGMYYSFLLNEYKEMDNISKDDILAMITHIMENEDASFDTYEESAIVNKVQNIIYKNLEKKFSELLISKNGILESINTQYKEAEDKYINKTKGE